MEQMASRPFSQVLVEIERREKLGPDLSPNLPSAPNNISTSGDTTAVVVTDSTAASPAIVGSATLATGTTTLRKRKKVIYTFVHLKLFWLGREVFQVSLTFRKLIQIFY